MNKTNDHVFGFPLQRQRGTMVGSNRGRLATDRGPEIAARAR
jgi:hypothetical protein